LTQSLFSELREREEEKAGRIQSAKKAIRPASQTSEFIVLYIRLAVYDFEKLSVQFVRRFGTHACPACQSAGTLKKHAWYSKYYYTRSIRILRCICAACGVTHAIIPSFSLPGTSIGTEEAQIYIQLREQGYGRGRASKVFSGAKQMSANHPAVLDKAFRVAVDRAKAIFTGQADERLAGCAWIASLTGETDQPMVRLNQYCLEHRVNGVCLTRTPIHLFRDQSSRIRISHNHGSAWIFKLVIDSW
jgi:hypothetical protein